MLNNLESKRIVLKKNISKTVLALKVMTIIDAIISVVNLVFLSLAILFFMEFLGTILKADPDINFSHSLLVIMPSAIVLSVIFFFIYRWYSKIAPKIAIDTEVPIVLPLALTILALLFFLYQIANPFYDAFITDNKTLVWPFNLYEMLLLGWLVVHVVLNGILVKALYDYNRGLTDKLNNNTQLTE